MANKEIFLNSGAHKVDLPKGTFDKSFRNHLTAKLGYLYPCLVEEAVAGSTYKIKPDMVFDLMPMAMPLQSRMRVHVSLFNVPFRILMKSYKDYFSRVGNHQMPYIAQTDDWVTPGSLADYMGLPTAQFSEASSKASLDFSLHGKLTNSFTDFIVSPSDSSESKSFDLSQLLSSSGTYNLVYTDVMQYPSSDGVFSFSVFAASSTNINLRLGALIGSEATGRYFIACFHGAGTGNVFSYSSSSPLPAGTYTHDSGVVVYNVGPSTNFRQFEYTFKLSESDLELLNTWINQPGASVRLFLATTGYYFSNGYGSVPTLQDAINLVRVVSSFNKESEQGSVIPSVNYLATSSIIQNLTYSGLFSSVETSRKYFNVVEGEPPVLPVNALPFRAYEFIYNKYFRNLQVDKFYKNGEVSYNEYITNDGDGADSTTPVELKRVPYEYDVFTTALPSPQMGYAPLVGVTTNNDSGTGILHMIPLIDGQPDPTQAYDIAVSYNSDNGDVTAISNYDEVANHTSVARLQEAIDFGISINDLRNVSAFQRLKEKMMKAGYEYQPLMEEFYGTVPPIGEEFPEYLGGFTREIQIGKIQNTALTADHPLGEFAGVGGVAGASRTIKVYTKEPSYIIGVLWFSVTPTYSQMLPKHFLKFHPLDYFNPTFNAIGPQPIHTHEIAPLQLPPEELDKVFGYQRPWYDYVSRVDECHGEFRTSMRHYLLQRLFAVAPELTANFINIHSEELTDIFTYTVDTDKFFGYIDFDIKCKSPVARVSVPRIIG